MPPNTSQQNMDNSLIHRQQFRQQQQQQQQQQMIQRPLQHLLNRKGSSGSIQSRSCKTEGHGVSATVCANCGTTTTPLWRRAPNGETICNACGLYLKARNTVRPPWLKRNAIKKATPTVPETLDNNNNGTCPGDGHCDGTGGSSSCDGCPAYNQHQVNRQALICANCGTNTTPLWRRDEAGNTICNACGLYFKLHNVHRPVTMKRSVIKRRKRVALATSPPPQTHHQSGGSDNEQSRKGRVHHPPTPASTSGSERGYISSDDDVSVEEFNSNRKRKADESIVSNKRRCGNSRHVPPIEDYISSKRTSHHHGEWIPNNNYDERRRSLTPVEPTLPQVHIHQNNTAYNSRLMGTPSVPLLPSVFHNNDGANSPNHCPVSFAPSTQTPGPSSSISALLNPSSPTTAPPQLPPISSSIPPNIMTPSTPPHLPPMNNGAPMNNDPNITQQVLQAHRQELQREVSHLSMLLNRTTAILVGLDQAMASNAAARAVNTDNSSLPSMNYGSPTDGTLYNGQKSSYTGLPSPPVNAGVGQKSYVQNVTLPPLSPPAAL